jgi:hypothetical protein
MTQRAPTVEKTLALTRALTRGRFSLWNLNSFSRKMSSLDEQIQQQGDRIRSLKLSKTDPSLIEQEVATLKALKAQLSGSAPAQNGSKGSKKSSKTAFSLKVPKVRSFPHSSHAHASGAGHQRSFTSRDALEESNLRHDHLDFQAARRRHHRHARV